MALSGSFYKNVGSHWRLQGEWSATQDVSANTSTVTLKTYWMALDSYGAISSSATKSGSSTIEGTADAFSGAGLAGLSSNQKKLLQTQTKTVTHASDGTFSDLDLAISFDAEVTLGGTYYGTISATASVALNTIPRASSLTSSASWTAGGTVSFAVSRASSSFDHDIVIKVNGVTIKTITGVATSYTWTPSATEQENIFKELAKDTTSWNQASSIDVKTYSGSSLIGTKTYSGTVSSPSASTVTSSADAVFNIGDAVGVGVTRSDSDFTHTVRFYVNNVLMKTITGVTTSTTWTPTSTENTNMYNQTPNSNTVSTKIELDTFYGATKVRATTSVSGTATVTNSNPTFGTGYTFQDTNSVTKTLTGGSYMVQGKSLVQVDLPIGAKATANNGATMSTYVATINGVSVSKAYDGVNTVSFTMGAIAVSGNVTLSVKAIDSRGNSTTTTKVISVTAYTTPVVTATATRNNGFDAGSTIVISGSVSSVNGLNSLQTYTYKTKLSTDASYGAVNPQGAFGTAVINGLNFTIPNKAITLDNTLTYNIEITITDKLGSTVVVKTVSSGTPLLFIDSTKKSVGVNKFPALPNTFEVNGQIRASNGVIVEGGYFEVDSYNETTYGSGRLQTYYDANNRKWQISARDGANAVQQASLAINGRIELGTSIFASAGGGIDLNNSDIIGANNIFMEDKSDGDSEAIQWAKSTTPVGSTNPADYDSFRISEGVAMINSVPISVNPSAVTLWSGNSYMNDTQTAVPTKKISECANGWILCFTDYDSATSTVNDSDVTLCYIHKKAVANFNGKWFPVVFANYTTSVVIKYLAIYDDKITGHSANDGTTATGEVAGGNDAVLRRVWEW